MSWTITKHYEQEKTIAFGNTFMTGNGYMGYRGTLEEYGKDELVACNLSGLYDQAGDAWREPINAPNGFFTKVSVNGSSMSVLDREPETHQQNLIMDQVLHRRQTTFASEQGPVTIKAERFISSADHHLMALRYSIQTAADSDVVITTGIDGDVWDVNGPHLFDYQTTAEGKTLALTATTGELHKQVAVADTIQYAFDAAEVIEETDKQILRKLQFRAEAGKTYELTKVIAVVTEQDVADPAAAAWQLSQEGMQQGYEALKAAHITVWQKRWAVADVEIEGDDEAQLALRYSIYQLQIIAPHYSDTASIPARGLSGQTYKGAIFWDTEMFMLPFFLHTDPTTAKNLVHYRVHTLDGARAKAREYGFRGAFYAWESQEDGQDACSDYNVTDVFTKRPMRTYFRDKQIHISGDVAYGLWETYRFTGDDAVLLDGGAEVILECARFFLSYAYFKHDKDRYEIIDVIGPDEYHERVYNNAYTNKMVAFTLETAQKVCDLLATEHPAFYNELIEELAYQDDLQIIDEMLAKLYVPQPDPETEVIEQFDGYLGLEDCSVDEVRARLLDPKEYWGGAYGVASDTQVLKQADVVLMLYLFKEQYSQAVKQKNWAYYEPRTEHGSSLSPCIYALLACDVGNQEWGYPYFMKTATVDLTGESKQFAGTIYIGGTHPAANGGAWMAAVLGFGGLSIKDNQIEVNPHLPEKWQKLSFHVMVQDELYQITITKEETVICKK